MSILHINAKEFSNTINNDLVLIDFFADWCGPCKMLGPVLEQLGDSRALKIAKINVDDNQTLAQTLGIMTIPTLLLYSNGKLLAQTSGFMPQIEIEKWIDQNK
ncbi:MAG: thioredoxin [Bacilli bacterium]